MRCLKCGFENTEGLSVCSNCGNTLIDNNVNQPEELLSVSSPEPTPFIPNEPVVNNQPVANNVVDKEDKGKKKSPLLLIAIIAIVGLLVLGIVIVPKLFGKTASGSGNKNDNSNAFFLANNEGTYAVFNADGKQLTDFNIKSSFGEEFKNHTCFVENIDGKRGIIKDNGKMLVDFEKYTFLNNVGALYLGTVDGKEYLIN